MSPLDGSVWHVGDKYCKVLDNYWMENIEKLNKHEKIIIKSRNGHDSTICLCLMEVIAHDLTYNPSPNSLFGYSTIGDWVLLFWNIIIAQQKQYYKKVNHRGEAVYLPNVAFLSQVFWDCQPLRIMKNAPHYVEEIISKSYKDLNMLDFVYTDAKIKFYQNSERDPGERYKCSNEMFSINNNLLTTINEDMVIEALIRGINDVNHEIEKYTKKPTTTVTLKGKKIEDKRMHLYYLFHQGHSISYSYNLERYCNYEYRFPDP
jgi:hypothetical protein